MYCFVLKKAFLRIYTSIVAIGIYPCHAVSAKVESVAPKRVLIKHSINSWLEAILKITQHDSPCLFVMVVYPWGFSVSVFDGNPSSNVNLVIISNVELYINY